MKEAYQPSIVHEENLKFFLCLRKNVAALAGTATLAIFLASVATPAEASRHHHHHHHRQSVSEQVASTPRHHHHHHRSEEYASEPVRHHHRHHHYYSSDTAYAPESYATHSERLAMFEAHHENVLAANRALDSGNVVRAAEAFRGTPYVMGGSSRSGFDCSGFTRFILGRSAGVDLPRTAEEQYYTGQPIEKDEMKPGDLVFFRDTYRYGISHVGMYIGNDKFVHACSPSEGVTVSSLDEQYYINHWAGARRVLKLRSESGDL